MAAREDTLHQLVAAPRESLAVELKRWFDPTTDEGRAKVARTCLALRNNNGGYLVVGIDDKTRKPNSEGAPKRWWENFHQDLVQGIVSKYTSEFFEVHVHVVQHESHHFVVIEVESGFEAPVAAKAQLGGNDTRAPLIQRHAVYVRSLAANGIVSTTEARYQDWPRVVRLGFDNREADIGRFLRRHLGPDSVTRFAAALSEISRPLPSDEDLALDFLDACRGRFDDAYARWRVDAPDQTPVDLGHGTREIAVIVVPSIAGRIANIEFRRLLMASNPEYTGLPPWGDTSSADIEANRPYVLDGGWQNLLSAAPVVFPRSVLDFWRLEPSGKFYLRRALEDDMHQDTARVPPGELLDFGLQVLRVAEAMAVSLEFARAMACPPDETELVFAVRWQELAGRALASWADPGRSLSYNPRTVQDEVVSYVRVPLDTPGSALPRFVQEAIAPLFAVFDGYELSMVVFEDLVSRLLNRQL